MKSIFISLMAGLLFFTACNSSKHVSSSGTPQVNQVTTVTEPANKPVNFSDPQTWILGYFRVSKLYEQPWGQWFIKGFDDYVAVPDAVNKLKTLLKPGITVKIVMGTWCPDSRREVPRFMRVISDAGFDEGNIEFIGVDNSKVGPVKDYDKLEIARVPTFIIYKNNVEAGRIIENPVTSLEQDIVNILTKE